MGYTTIKLARVNNRTESKIIDITLVVGRIGNGLNIPLDLRKELSVISITENN